MRIGKPVVVNSLHPGKVYTEFGRFSIFLKMLLKVIIFFLKVSLTDKVIVCRCLQCIQTRFLFRPLKKERKPQFIWLWRTKFPT